MATLAGRVLRVFPPVNGERNALYSKDITAESVYGNLLREHALQAGATVGPNRRVNGELRQSLDETCELLKTTPPIAVHWETSHQLRILTADFRWIHMTFHPHENRLTNVRQSHLLPTADSLAIDRVKDAVTYQNDGLLTVLALLQDSSILFIREQLADSPPPPVDDAVASFQARGRLLAKLTVSDELQHVFSSKDGDVVFAILADTSLLAYPFTHETATDSARFKSRPVAAMQWKEAAAQAVTAVKAASIIPLPEDVVYSCKIVCWRASRTNNSLVHAIVSVMCELPQRTPTSPGSSSTQAQCVSAWLVAQTWTFDALSPTSSKRKAGFGLTLVSQSACVAHEDGKHVAPPNAQAEHGISWASVVFVSPEALATLPAGPSVTPKSTRVSTHFSGRCPIQFLHDSLLLYPRLPMGSDPQCVRIPFHGLFVAQDGEDIPEGTSSIDPSSATLQRLSYTRFRFRLEWKSSSGVLCAAVFSTDTAAARDVWLTTLQSYITSTQQLPPATPKSPSPHVKPFIITCHHWNGANDTVLVGCHGSYVLVYDCENRQWKSSRLPKLPSEVPLPPSPHTGMAGDGRPHAFNHQSIVSVAWLSPSALAVILLAGQKIVVVDTALNVHSFVTDCAVSSPQATPAHGVSWTEQLKTIRGVPIDFAMPEPSKDPKASSDHVVATGPVSASKAWLDFGGRVGAGGNELLQSFTFPFVPNRPRHIVAKPPPILSAISPPPSVRSFIRPDSGSDVALPVACARIVMLSPTGGMIVLAIDHPSAHSDSDGIDPEAVTTTLIASRRFDDAINLVRSLGDPDIKEACLDLLLSSLLDLSNCDPRDDTNTVPVMDDIATMCHASTTPPNSSTVLAVALQDREPSSLCGPAALVAALGLLLEFASQYDDVSTGRLTSPPLTQLWQRLAYAFLSKNMFKAAMCVGRQLHSTSLLREVGVWADVCGEVVLATVAMREATAITVGKPSATSERLIIPVDVITPETVAARVRHVQSVLEGQELNAAIASCGDVGLAVTSAVMTAASGDVKPAIAALEALQLSRHGSHHPDVHKLLDDVESYTERLRRIDAAVSEVKFPYEKHVRTVS